MKLQESKNLINNLKNIYLISSESHEAIASTLALFYTLREINKNVNIITENIPSQLKFLTPSLDFITSPKNFVISIPNKVADVSRIYYEKNDNALKIHLTVESGNIKKDNISFYFSEEKPDLIITIGIKNYQEQLKKMDSFGFLLDSDILNIDSNASIALDLGEQDNTKFGKINLIDSAPLTQIILDLIKELAENKIKKDSATCLLSGLVIYTDNFKNNITSDIFQTASNLMKEGADIKTIINNLTNSQN